MKIKLTFLIALLLGACFIPQLKADTDININIGLPVVVLDHEPAMAVVPGTYIYFFTYNSVDFFFYGGHWWRFHHSRWYRAKNYNGPWLFWQNKRIPTPLLRLPPEWRRQNISHSGIKCQDMRKHWRKWEKQKRWEQKMENREQKLENKKDKKQDDKGKKSSKGKKRGQGRK